MKEFLSQRGVQYVEHDVSADRRAAEEMYRLTGQVGVPVTVIDGSVVVGFDRTGLERALGAAQTGTGRGPFGLRIADAARVAREKGLALPAGAYVDRVVPDSAAARAGLMPGDVVTDFNQRPVTGADDLEKVLAALAAGDRFSLGFVRGGRSLQVESVV